jgi:septum formation protein
MKHPHPHPRPRLYLASQSPRRRQLLELIGAQHELLLPGPEEDAEALEAVRPGELPAAYVQRVTRAKLAAARVRLAARGLPPGVVLCADTTVALGRVMLAKPADPNDAQAMLEHLSGRSHRVWTAVSVHDGTRARHALNITRVRFARLPPAVIAAYIASGEPFGKAGAYAIQGALAGYIEAIDGSHSGVMGLPLFETTHLLKAAGVALALSP